MDLPIRKKTEEEDLRDREREKLENDDRDVDDTRRETPIFGDVA